VRVIGADGKQAGVMSLNDALTLARQHGVDLVEIAPTATPPVCRVVDYGKFRYEQAKKDKESKKHQHATQVKEIQLSPRIDPHDLGVKIQHAIEFLCEDMKVKVALRFRGREMQHTEFGFEVIQKFLAEVEPWGHRDFEPKLIGKGINVMVSPLPRNKRAKNPHEEGGGGGDGGHPHKPKSPEPVKPGEQATVKIHHPGKSEADGEKAGNFAHNPFANLNVS
jgi:translation initiation factor IF-3